MFTIVVGHGICSDEYLLTIQYLRWQRLCRTVEARPVGEILLELKGRVNPNNAFYVLDSNGNKLVGFHAVIDAVTNCGLRQMA